MSEIQVALWPRGPRAEQEVAALLQRYHAQNPGAHIHAQTMDEQNPWSNVSHTMSYRDAVDVNELGASWVEGLVSAHSLRPFSSVELESLGDTSSFLLPPWKLKKPNGEEITYSIPHRVDTRLIFYRRDLLAQAGVDESSAFATPQAILQTLESLKKHGGVWSSPLVAPVTTQSRLNLSMVASWIWNMGGDFINEDGSQATFAQPEALAGIADYLRAVNYIAPEFRQFEAGEGELEFCKGNAAVIFSGPWMFFLLQAHAEFARVRENVGIAQPPAQAYRGGTHLSIWQHSKQPDATLDFIRFLTSADVQAGLSGEYFMLPARRDAVQSSRYDGDPNYQKIMQIIQAGRSYRSSPLWNVVEDRFSRLLMQVVTEYFETPGIDLNTFLPLRLKPLARRINISFAE